MNQLLETPCDKAAKPARNEANPPHRILVAEDDREIRQGNAMVLTYAGYAVDIAVDGAAAWEALYTKRYDLLITDNNMPKLTGVELVRKLHSARMVLPVIMATGRLPTEVVAQDPSLQLAAVLPKPFSIDELLDTVRAVLRATDRAPGNPRHDQAGETGHRSGVRLTFPQPEHLCRG